MGPGVAGRTGRRSAGTRRMLLAHPLFTGAVALLAVNDAVLKSRWPSWWTGKLSDLAGVVVVTVLLTVVTGNPTRSGGLTTVGFAALKLVPGVAEAAVPLLGGLTRRDATDLVALAAIPPTVWALDTLLVQPRPPSGSAVAMPDAGRLRRLAGLPGAALAMSGATLGILSISATSCGYSPVVADVVARDGVVWATTDGIDDPDDADTSTTSTTSTTSAAEAVQEDWERSDDGGRTWAPSDPPPTSPDPVSAPEATTACSDDTGCFRITEDGRRIEHQPQEGEPWTTGFTYTDEQWRRIQASYQSCLGQPDEVVFSDVVVVPRRDGDHVVVAAGADGVLHRTAEGTWERRAVLDATPAHLDDPSRLRYLLIAPGLLAAGATIVLLVALIRQWPTRAVAAPAVALGGGVTTALMFTYLDLAAVDHTVSGPLLAGLSVAVFVASLVVALVGRRAPRPSSALPLPPRPPRPPPPPPWPGPRR